MPGKVAQLEREFSNWLGVPGLATGFGRSALRLAFDTLGCAGKTVLLPDFICAQVVQAAEEAGAQVAFYPVQRNLSIHTKDFCAALDGAPIAAVIPHYFGEITENVTELVTACQERGVAGIEDCALALGASLQGRRAGTLGDMAVFSFTKSDWCYGGGFLAMKSDAYLGKARSILDSKFREDKRGAFLYGLLRRLDWIANRPRWTASAELAGRWVDRISGVGEGNFYDAGCCDAALPEFAASRARKILGELEESMRRQREARARILAELGESPRIVLERRNTPGDSGAFLLLQLTSGQGREWVRRAATEGVTLRLPWPAYQELAPGQGSEALAWLAEHLLVVEVHAGLKETEITAIAACLRCLAAEDGD